jgi:hypothetical protein
MYSVASSCKNVDENKLGQCFAAILFLVVNNIVQACFQQHCCDQVVAMVDENRIEQCFAAHIVHSCQQYCYTRFRLNNIVQYC